MLSARGRHGDGSRPAAPRVAFKCAATCAPIGRGAGKSQCIYAMDAVRPPKGTGKPIITGVKGSPRVSSTTASIKSHFVEENKIRPRTKQSQVSPPWSWGRWGLEICIWGKDSVFVVCLFVPFDFLLCTGDIFIIIYICIFATDNNLWNEGSLELAVSIQGIERIPHLQN